jgi:hypothetical protein
VRWYVIGAVLGLFASSLLVGSWHQSTAGLSVTVLGAGRQASVLITSNHRHILIAAGTNGTAFSNAVSNALTPVDSEFALVLIDPTASQDVQERVRSLDAQLVWILPARSEPPTTGTVDRSFTVEFDEATQVRVRLGFNGGWHAELISAAGSVVITPDAAAIGNLPQPFAVAILTHEQDDSNEEFPLIIGVTGTVAPEGRALRVVAPGSTIRLDLDNGQIRTEAA